MTYVDTQKYLGIEIKTDFTDYLDSMRQVKALYTRGNMLADLTSVRMTLNTVYSEANVLAVMVVHYGIFTKRTLIGNVL